MSYDTMASSDAVTHTIKSLSERGFLPETVATGADALARIKALIPKGASVMNGSSRTLEEIGFIEYLKSGAHEWNNLHKNIIQEGDPAKQAILRKQSVISDFYLGSVHALAKTGDIIIASASGSQLPHVTFTSPNIILVVGEQKITADLVTALERLETYVFPLENERMKSAGMGGSMMAKQLIWKREPAFMGRKVHIILVEEKLGF